MVIKPALNGYHSKIVQARLPDAIPSSPQLAEVYIASNPILRIQEMSAVTEPKGNHPSPVSATVFHPHLQNLGNTPAVPPCSWEG